MFLRNCWYVAALSEEVGRELRAVKIMGENIVLYRRHDGRPVALEDACPHRKLPLSLGRLAGDELECGYHGLTFNGAGLCVKAPTQGKIPGSAQVHSYPVLDRYEFLWIWMGDPADVSREGIIQIDNYDSEHWGKTNREHMDVDCNYLLIMDNLLDPSHVAWVHRSSFAGDGAEDTPLEVRGTDDGYVVSRWVYDVAPPPYYARLVQFAGHCDRLQHYEARMPSIAINKSIFTPPGTGGPDAALTGQSYVMISYHFMTPVDDSHTRYFWFQHRNTEPTDPAVSEYISQGARKAFDEDRLILNAVQAGLDNETRPPIDLALDAGALRFRKKLDRAIDAEQRAGAG